MSAPRIPVTIVTGFLGSGKTTLLAGLLRRRRHRRLALLINEFGEISIDGAVLRSDAASGEQPGDQGTHAVSIVELSQGLIAYGDDTRFMSAMQAIAAQRATIDHVLIETSGLALPSAVMELLQGPLLADDFILDATLAVVDTPLLLASGPGAAVAAATPPRIDTHADADASAALLFAQQLALADVVVLNKIDQLDEAALLRAETLVRDCAPNVRFLELAYHAELDLRVALGLRLHQVAEGAAAHAATNSVAHAAAAHGGRLTYSAYGAGAGINAAVPVAAPAFNQQPFNGHAHSGMGAHSHGLATHRHFHEQDPGWLSFTLRSEAMQPLPLLQQALVEAARCEPVLRSKGYVRTAGRAQPVLVQGVRTRVTLAAPEPAKNNGEQRGKDSHAPATRQRSELVFIGYHLSRARVARLLSGITATEWR